MKTTAAARLAILALLVLVLAAALACGDDDAPPGDSPTPTAGLEQYFLSLKDIFVDADNATSRAQETLNEVPTDAPLDEQVEAIDTYLGAIDTIFGQAIERLDALAAPEATEDSHSDFTDAVSESREAGNVLREDLAAIETQEDLDERLAEFDSEVQDSVVAADEACFGLQDTADQEGIEVDLACEE